DASQIGIESVLVSRFETLNHHVGFEGGQPLFLASPQEDVARKQREAGVARAARLLQPFVLERQKKRDPLRIQPPSEHLLGTWTGVKSPPPPAGRWLIRSLKEIGRPNRRFAFQNRHDLRRSSRFHNRKTGSDAPKNLRSILENE